MGDPGENNAAFFEAAKTPARAEFRVFGRGVIDTVKARMWNAHAVLQGVRNMPPEIYFVSALTDDANVKVRDGLLDIKVKTGETPAGYEIFQPRGKFAFPVKRDELAAALSELEASIDLTEEAYTIEAAIALARRRPELVPVTVQKTRSGFTVNAVICEFTEVWFNGALMESACCESEDYGAISQVVEALGLSGLENVNYIKAAKRIIGMV
jgi:hypothetical protein